MKSVESEQQVWMRREEEVKQAAYAAIASGTFDFQIASDSFIRQYLDDKWPAVPLTRENLQAIQTLQQAAGTFSGETAKGMEWGVAHTQRIG